MTRKLVAMCGCGSTNIHDGEESYTFTCDDCGITDYWENASIEDAEPDEDDTPMCPRCEVNEMPFGEDGVRVCSDCVEEIEEEMRLQGIDPDEMAF